MATDQEPTAAPASFTEQAAILMTLLGEEESRWLLGKLEPAELQALGTAMCDLGEIGSDQIAATIRSFADAASKPGPPPGDPHARVKAMMTGALGDFKASTIMSRINRDDTPIDRPALELAKWLRPESILPLIKDEHPQSIALLLVQLDAQDAAIVLASLDEEMQPRVVQRIGRLGPVSAEALEMLNEHLQDRIEKSHGSVPVTIGGVCEAARIINATATSVEKRIMPALGELDRELLEEIERQMVRFEDLYSLDSQSMGQLLREVESDVLIKALKGIAEPAREVFFASMSKRAAEGLREEIEDLGRIRRADSQEAQASIIATARKLAEDGTIMLGDGGDDFV